MMTPLCCPRPRPECARVLLSPRHPLPGTRSPRFPPFGGCRPNTGTGTCLQLPLIVPTPSNAPNCTESKRGTHRPPGWRPRTRRDKIGPSYPTPAFSGAQKWADWLHDRCLLWGPIGVGIGNCPKSCRAHALRANAPSCTRTPCTDEEQHRKSTQNGFVPAQRLGNWCLFCWRKKRVQANDSQLAAHRKSSTEDRDTAWVIRDLHHQEEAPPPRAKLYGLLLSLLRQN